MSATEEIDYQAVTFPYARVPELDLGAPTHRRMVVVGAGPVGLATAIDLAQNGIEVLLLDDDDRLSTGSRAICFAKRTLEIFDRLGCGEPIIRKGVSWNRGRVFLHEDEVYSFDLLPEEGHHRPAFINLQQYYVEGYLFERARELPNLEIRWKNKVAGVVQDGNAVTLQIETPDCAYALACDYLVAADGSRSFIRKALGHESKGQTFRDRFLIADVRMEADFPAERWFWFDPPFHPGQSVLLHRQSDNVWRIDFQLGWDADPVAEREPERVLPRVQALLGREAKFELVWASVYTFSCLRMAAFRDGRVLFRRRQRAWRLAFRSARRKFRRAGRGKPRLEAQARARRQGARSAPRQLWGRARIRGGRKHPQFDPQHRFHHAQERRQPDVPQCDASTLRGIAVLPASSSTADGSRSPTTLSASPLNTPDEDFFEGAMTPGAPITDAPLLRDGAPAWLLDETGDVFTLLHFSADGATPEAARLNAGDIPVKMLVIAPNDAARRMETGMEVFEDVESLAAQRFDAASGATYLIRPDQHVCARWRAFDPEKVQAALDRATARS